MTIKSASRAPEAAGTAIDTESLQSDRSVEEARIVAKALADLPKVDPRDFSAPLELMERLLPVNNMDLVERGAAAQIAAIFEAELGYRPENLSDAQKAGWDYREKFLRGCLELLTVNAALEPPLHSGMFEEFRLQTRPNGERVMQEELIDGSNAALRVGDTRLATTLARSASYQDKITGGIAGLCQRMICARATGDSSAEYDHNLAAFQSSSALTHTYHQTPSPDLGLRAVRQQMEYGNALLAVSGMQERFHGESNELRARAIRSFRMAEHVAEKMGCVPNLQDECRALREAAVQGPKEEKPEKTGGARRTRKTTKS